MSYSRNAEDSVLDSIDELVDDSLSRGDQSGSWRGERYERCTLCSETWHYLPITRTMQAMRAGSYARDEFGQGIVDPAYRYELDESDLVCPGSSWLGPPTNDREWKWAKKKWGRPIGSIGDAYAYDSGPSRSFRGTPRNDAVNPRINYWRFVGPFDGFEISLDDTRELEDIIPGMPGAPFVPDHSRRRTIQTARHLTATFELENPIRSMDLSDHQRWRDENQAYIRGMGIDPQGEFYTMAPVVMPFRSFSVQGNPNQQFPNWIQFETTYDPTRIPWFAPYWERIIPAPLSEPLDIRIDREYPDHNCCDECTPGVYHHLDHGECNSGAAAMYNAEQRQGFESDYVIIDETHEHTNREVSEYVNAIQEATRSLAAESLLPQTTYEAWSELQRGPEVLRSGEEDPPGQDRQVAAATCAGSLQEASDAVVSPGEPEAEEAGDEGS